MFTYTHTNTTHLTGLVLIERESINARARMLCTTGEIPHTHAQVLHHHLLLVLFFLFSLVSKQLFHASLKR